MKRLTLICLLALVCSNSAFAQEVGFTPPTISSLGAMKNDASNAVLPNARTNLGLGTANNVNFNSLTLGGATLGTDILSATGSASLATTATGVLSGQRGLFNGFPEYLMSVSENVTGLSGNSGIVGFESDLTNTGTTAENGSRTAIVGSCKLGTAIAFVSGKTTNCTGGFFLGSGTATQNGTVGGANAAGQVWGIAAIASLYSPATGYISVSNEFDVVTKSGTSTNTRFGVNSVDFSGASGVQATLEDAAYAINASTGSAGFHIGIDISGNGGGTPLDSGSTVLKATTPVTVVNGIDMLTNFTVTNNPFQSAGFHINNVGAAFVEDLRITHATQPQVIWDYAGAAADNRLWYMDVSGTAIRGYVSNDAVNAFANWISVTRSGATISGITLGSGSNTFNLVGIGAASGSDILCYNPSGGAVTYANSVVGCVPSSVRFKEEHERIDSGRALSGIISLTPAIYSYSHDLNLGDNEQIGIYAEEVCAIDERLCHRDMHGRIDNYDKIGLTAYIIGAIKELNSRLDWR